MTTDGSASLRRDSLLDGIRKEDPDWPEIVRRVMTYFRSETVTIHRLDREKGELRLAAVNPGLPPPLYETIRLIPVGKGMAGVAALEKRPVTTCNIQTDSANTAIRPGARQTGMCGAVVVPVFGEDGTTVLGTLGIGTRREHEYAPSEVADLEHVASRIANLWMS